MLPTTACAPTQKSGIGERLVPPRSSEISLSCHSMRLLLDWGQAWTSLGTGPLQVAVSSQLPAGTEPVPAFGLGEHVSSGVPGPQPASWFAHLSGV
jgi:hypothetical protein